MVAIQATRPCGDDFFQLTFGRNAQGQVNIGPMIETIDSGRAEMCRLQRLWHLLALRSQEPLLFARAPFW
jgi:hypothetical protein